MARRRDPLLFLESYVALKRRLDAVCAETYGASEFSAVQAKILRHVANQPGISQAELARATATDPALVGRALQPMLDLGWIERRRSDEDRREYVLSLTPAGRGPHKRACDVRASLAAKLVAYLDERDLEDFDRIVGKLAPGEIPASVVKAETKPSAPADPARTRRTRAAVRAPRR